MNRKLINKKDFIIIILILLLAFTVYFIANKFIYKTSATAEIIYDGKVIQTVDLNKDCVFSPQGFQNIKFQIKNGSIAFIESDCPDKICVNTGFINSTGQNAVCLPNKMVLRLISDEDSPDAVM